MNITDSNELRQLIKAAQAGNTAARETVALTHRVAVHKAVHRHVYAEEEWDDAIQEGMVVLLEAIDHYDPQRCPSFKGYLGSQLRFYYLRRAAGQGQRSVTPATSLEVLLTDGFDVPAPLPEAQDARLDDILHALRRLSPETRSIIADYLFSDAQQKELARRRGLSLSTFRSRLYSGFRKLRSFL